MTDEKKPIPRFRVTNPTNTAQPLRVHGQMLACDKRRSIVVQAKWDNEEKKALTDKGLKVESVSADTDLGYDPLPSADDVKKAIKATADAAAKAKKATKAE